MIDLKYELFKENFENLSSAIIEQQITSPKRYCFITQCGKKKYPHYSQAKDLYASLQIKYLKEITALYPQDFDMWILSAGYGWVHQDTLIAPYEQSFNDLKASDIIKFSREKLLRNQFNFIISHYDKVFIALGDKYLMALDLEKSFDISALAFILPEGVRGTKKEPKGSGVEKFYTSISHTTLHGASVINLKGKILSDFIKEIIKKEGSVKSFNSEDLEHYIQFKTLRQ